MRLMDEGGHGLRARFVGSPLQQEVRLLLVAGNPDFFTHTRSCVSVLATHHNHLIGALDPLRGLLLPARGGVLNRPVGNLERRVVVLWLTHEQGLG